LTKHERFLDNRASAASLPRVFASMGLERMRLPWIIRKRKRAIGDIGARCPQCHCELPLMFEQSLLLADDKRVWLFCPICARTVAGEGFFRQQGQRAGVRGS
jgi:hypothetical protein